METGRNDAERGKHSKTEGGWWARCADVVDAVWGNRLQVLRRRSVQ